MSKNEAQTETDVIEEPQVDAEEPAADATEEPVVADNTLVVTEEGATIEVEPEALDRVQIAADNVTVRGVAREPNTVSWTVQSGESYDIPDSKPGQTFVEAQLPDVEAQREAGVDIEQFRTHLFIVEDDHADKGTAPDDVVSGRVYR